MVSDGGVKDGPRERTAKSEKAKTNKTKQKKGKNKLHNHASSFAQWHHHDTHHRAMIWSVCWQHDDIDDGDGWLREEETAKKETADEADHCSTLTHSLRASHLIPSRKHCHPRRVVSLVHPLPLIAFAVPPPGSAAAAAPAAPSPFLSFASAPPLPPCPCPARAPSPRRMSPSTI